MYSTGNTDCMLYVVTDLPSDYCIDSVTAEELVLPDNWKTTAAETIEAIRKADITLRFVSSLIVSLYI